MEMREEIIRMVSEITCLPVDIDGKTNLYLDLGLDSLSFIVFLLKVEKRYGISFEITEMGNCLQIDYLSALVESKVRERGGKDD